VDTLPGEYDRSGPRRFVTVSANMNKTDLATATAAIQKSINEMGEPPAGLVANIMGESALLVDTLNSLQTGLFAAIIVIMLLLAANFQSFGLSLAVLSSIPAVLLGAMLILLATGSDINLQSYMGLIMSTGTSVANAVLIVTNAEHLRHEYKDPFKAAAVAASLRFRPIMMTTISMIVGMIPMATGIGEAGDESAPLGRAVIGGLACSTVASLFIVPLVYGWIMQRSSLRTPSLLPDNDPDNEPDNHFENTPK
jgi:multidrug efflux pump subunit AcrB